MFFDGIIIDLVNELQRFDTYLFLISLDFIKIKTVRIFQHK